MNILRKIRRPFKYSYFNAAFLIIGINIAVFLLLKMIPRLAVYLSLNVIFLREGNMYWQFLTYMFVHGNFSHLFFNMLGIFFFGIAVERAIGSKEFLLLYFITGIMGGIISYFVYLLSGGYMYFLMGASGALYGLLFAFAVIFPRNNIYFWGIIPIPAPILVAIYVGIEISSQLLSFRDGVAHLTHLVGFAVAWIYFVVRMGINPWKVWKDAYR